MTLESQRVDPGIGFQVATFLLHFQKSAQAFSVVFDFQCKHTVLYVNQCGSGHRICLFLLL